MMTWESELVDELKRDVKETAGDGVGERWGRVVCARVLRVSF